MTENLKDNTKHLQEEPQEELGCIRRKFVSCFKGVRLLKTLIIFICIGIVVQQISVSIMKLIVVPVTTYTHFDFNRTLMYPSVTFCKEPAYKFDKMLDYGLYSHPRWSSAWINYNFSISLDDLWRDITYDPEEVFVQYGLEGFMENVEVTSTIGFVYGRCYTISPKVLCTHASKSSGYSITLRHTPEDLENLPGADPPGYHVFIHYTQEPFTEVEVYNGGLVQNIFVNVGETIDVKLTVDEYLMISDDDAPCTLKPEYSTNICTTREVWDVVGDEVGCSGPWMLSELPHCSNYSSMKDLIGTYLNEYQGHKTDQCPRFCQTYMYNAYVMQRNDLYVWDGNKGQWFTTVRGSNLQTQMYIYFNSMMVAVYKEQYNYDWNLFVSDLGGSVGFLLGISVIGLLKIFGKTWKHFIKPYLRNQKKTPSITSTVDVACKYPENQCNSEWKPSDL